MVVSSVTEPTPVVPLLFFIDKTYQILEVLAQDYLLLSKGQTFWLLNGGLFQNAI